MVDEASYIFFGRTDEGHFLQCQWDISWSAIVSNSHGKSGWARVLRSGGGAVPEGACRRIHLCSSNPCTARWAASKYGVMCPPIHLRPCAPAEVSFGPAPPESVPLRTGCIPPPAAIDPQWRKAILKSSEPPLATAAGHKMFHSILSLARSIRTPRTYVGYIFFVLLGLARKRRPCMWEGFNRVNLLETFAPWAMDTAVAECAVDGVVCCMRALPDGRAEMVHVSEDHPLAECRHFVACHKLEQVLDCEGDSIQAFYGRLGVVLLGTVMDGDCGLDTACMMMSLAQTTANRNALRQEIADYLCDRIEEPWMHQLLVVCAELNVEDLERFRSGGNFSITGIPADSVIQEKGATEQRADETAAVANCEIAAVAVVDEERKAAAVADCEIACVPADSGQEPCPDDRAVQSVEALKWSTGVQDEGVLHGLLATLPEWSIKEQIVAFSNRASKPAPPKQADKIIVDECFWHCRSKVAEAFDMFLRSRGVGKNARIPRHATTDFIKSRLAIKKDTKGLAVKIRRWHDKWTKDGKRPTADKSFRKKLCYGSTPHQKRLRGPGAGAHARCPWVRDALFEWFVSMRYSIDWRKYNQKLRSCGQHKAMGRFPVALLRQKAKQFLQDYLRVALTAVAAKVPRGMAIDWKWLKRWGCDYGVSMRAPNRKYKVPKWLLEERLVIWWLNLARVRTLCQECHKYDPEMENWDQSPFHRNEVGSQNAKTLAIEGSIEVPLIEGHADTRSRWTANLTTFSNKERILRGELPYSEFMFKADGEVLQGRLKEHLRSCGRPLYFSAATSEKGSYREEDILIFLDHHLPKLPQDPQLRQWRIIIADDFGPHKTDNVFRLCWGRWYVLLIHGGGATPVTQTPDTDLNQHVRRNYTARESSFIIEEMRRGVSVPKIPHTVCMDMMMDVLSDPKLHLHAADGYKKTGATVALDGSEDYMIVREAGEFFRSCGVRDKINREVALVREEVRAGRLGWTYEDVKRLIQPYPHNKIDKTLECIGDHYHLDSDEEPWGEEGAVGAASDDEDCNSEWGAPPKEESEAEKKNAVAVVQDSIAVAIAKPSLSPAAAEQLSDSEALVSAYDQAMDVLKTYGAVTAVQQLENEKRKELRRQRMQATDNPAVADALMDLKTARAREEREQMLAVRDANKKQQELARLRKESGEAAEMLQKRKKELLSVESILETRHAMKRYTPEALGQGKPRSGGVAARKLRYEVLDRLAKLGAGLTPAQKNDWSWFREAWDEKMCAEHAQEWGGVFSQWMQKVLDDLGDGLPNAFSTFMHNETVRNFNETPMLMLPGVGE